MGHPPYVVWKFLRRGDKVDVVEEEQADPQVKRLLATLPSANEQMQVSRLITPFCYCEVPSSIGVAVGDDEDRQAPLMTTRLSCSNPRGEQDVVVFGEGPREEPGWSPCG